MLRSPCEIARIEHVPSNLIEVESRCTILVLCGSKSSCLHRHRESSETNVVLYSYRREQRHWMPIFRGWWSGPRARRNKETKKSPTLSYVLLAAALWLLHSHHPSRSMRSQSSGDVTVCPFGRSLYRDTTADGLNAQGLDRYSSSSYRRYRAV